MSQRLGHVLSISNLISWLEHKPEDEDYEFWRSTRCLFKQYLLAHGFVHGSKLMSDAFTWLHQNYNYVACGEAGVNGWTFGQALDRAHEMRHAAGV